MKIILGKNCGFCNGVQYTINKANEILNNSANKIYCLGEIIHNEDVIKGLENKGMVTVTNINDIPNNETVIFRAHGESAHIYEIAKEKKLKIIDLTCGKVKLIHNKINKFKDKYFIIIIGKKIHPETIGSKGYADSNSLVIENIDDLENLETKFNKSKLRGIYIIAQTTFNDLLFDEISNKIKEMFKNIEVIIDKTICDATYKRQQEVMELAKKCNKMIIIGGINSSNTKELYLISKKNCSNSYLIQSVNDLQELIFNDNDISCSY